MGDLVETDRETFLKRVRDAVRAGAPVGTARAAAPRGPAAPMAFGPVLAARFRDEARRVGAHVRGPIRESEAASAVAEILSARGARRVVTSPLDLALPAGVERLHGRDGALAADAGVTLCDFGVAESGTLVLVAGPAAPRLPSLTPPIHVAIVRVATLVDTAADLFRVLPPEAAPSSIVLVTGPSRTGDIEQTLTVGVHGPGIVEIVVVE
jgi:L-lactate dehydrogenase complex protein LldG